MGCGVWLLVYWVCITMVLGFHEREKCGSVGSSISFNTLEDLLSWT